MKSAEKFDRTTCFLYICPSMETMLIILSVVFLCCALFLGQRWMQARAAAAEAAAAREAAERRAVELETRLETVETDSRASRERAEAEIRTLIESRTKAEAEAAALTRRMAESAAEREKAAKYQELIAKLEESAKAMQA